MTKEEHNTILNELRTTTDAGRRSELLQELDTDYTTVVANETEQNETITRLTDENESLRKANNSLWLERANMNPNVNNVNENVNNLEQAPKKIDISKLDYE